MLPAGLRIFLCTEPVDMRRSFDGLAAVVRQILAEEPQSGALFVFVNKRKNQLKALWWDANGYCLLYKRLHKAIFVLPGDLPSGGREAPAVRVDAAALTKLIAGSERRRSRAPQPELT